MVVAEDTVHELLSHLRDTAYLSAHPLAQALDASGLRRGDRLRQLLLALIEELRPADGTAATDPSWRPHLALKMRYVDQQSAFRVQSALSLSERQVRREQSRGVAALVALLQAAIEAAPPADSLSPEALTQAAGALHIAPDLLDARREMAGVAAVLAPRLARVRRRPGHRWPGERAPLRRPRRPAPGAHPPAQRHGGRGARGDHLRHGRHRGGRDPAALRPDRSGRAGGRPSRRGDDRRVQLSGRAQPRPRLAGADGRRQFGVLRLPHSPGR